MAQVNNRSMSQAADITIPLKKIPLAPTGATSEYLLVIDDSNQICSALVSGVVRACAEVGKTCQIIQSGPMGFIRAMPMDFSTNLTSQNDLTIYTANSCRNALPVLHLPTINRLTIICDVIMPNDRVVGLLGLLTELSMLGLPVNLLFASGEGQNRYCIEELLKNRKAYFIEKGTSAWAMLPMALVQRNDSFKYHRIVRADYDQGTLYHYNQRLPNAVAPVRAISPVPSPVTVVPPVAAPPPAQPQPRFKTSTGLLSLLTFWRKRAAS